MSPTLTTLATTTLIAVIFGIQNPATALVKPPISANEIVNSNQKISKYLDAIAQNTYRGPDRDFAIDMPGRITNNTNEQLTSVSSSTNTAYTIMHRDSPAATQLTPLQIRQVLQISMQEAFGGTGVVVRTTSYEIEGYPGLEILIRHSDGMLGQYRAFAVNQRLYFMGAVTPNKFTREAFNFFNSFRIYPERIRYSNSEVY
ncbi:MAG TPA: hypothetical protein IGS40_23130 [Trichormus sp. M33_DOE_039]|nr:hypothetical protein [Trichormus sp. M33_DOE_039]